MSAEDDLTRSFDWSDGRVIPVRAGKYRIVGRVGQGGMGVVYRAVDDDLGRTVALKFIPPELADRPHAEQRFLREARAASAMDHVNIGTIFGVEETGDHRRFIVMAYYEGQNLHQLIQAEPPVLSQPEAVGLAVQMLRGLAHAHSNGVIHRDIKPSNILVTRQGVVKIVDFGLASMADSDPITHTGTQVGTPAYMSPEQALGGAADHRSDIWSAGVVICEILTRQRVFQAPSVPAVLYQVVHNDVPALSQIQPPLRGVLAKALEKDPARRYQTMTEFLADLEAVPHDSALVLPTRVSSSAVAPAVRRRTLARWTIALGLVLVAGSGGTWVWKQRGSVPRSAGAAPASVYDKYSQAVTLARRWDKDGQLNQAIALFTEATTQDPKFALGFARLADAQRMRYALERDKAVLEEASRNAQTALRLNGDLSPVHVALGRIQMTQGNNDLALASFERALRIDPNDGDAHSAIARQYERQGRTADAEAAHRRATSLDPDSIAFHDSYANFLFRQTRHAEAIEQWRAVVRVAPDNATAYVNLGSALTERGQIAEAVTMYRRAVEIRPNYMAYNNLGTAYARAERYTEAAQAYRQAIALDSRDHLAWGNLGFVQSWMKDRRAATDTFRRAVELAEVRRQENPRDAFVHTDLALYYAKLGQAPLAATRLTTALALSPKVPEVLSAAAEVHQILGQRRQALEFTRQALAAGLPRQRLQRNPELAPVLSQLP